MFNENLEILIKCYIIFHRLTSRHIKKKASTLKKRESDFRAGPLHLLFQLFFDKKLFLLFSSKICSTSGVFIEAAIASKRFISFVTYSDIFILEKDGKVYLEIEKFNGKGIVSPAEVASELLKYIKQKTEEFQGQKLFKAVITVPAAFTEAKKAATLEAANLAGWKEIKLLPEPIAAAFAYFIDRPIPNNSNVLLFDLGGGTLDVCIFKVENNEIEIISNTGDSKFGGRDFDTLLINYFKNALLTKYGISLVKNKKYLLMMKCQKIKETLSVMANASLDIDDFDPHQEGIISISQDEFRKMSEPLLNKVKNTVNSAMHNSRLNENLIYKILLVGGGSRMPMIKELLKEIFPNANHSCEEHPDEVVAIGAAYYAYSIFSES